MVWNIQEFIQVIKDDLGLRDLPPAITDADIIKRIERSSLKDFSIIYPRQESFRIGINDMVDPCDRLYVKTTGIRYYIPKHFLMQYNPITCISVDVCNAYQGGLVWPYNLGYSPDDIMTGVAGIKALAGVAGNLCNAITHRYDNTKNWIIVYNGWTESTYEVMMGVMHDINLATIPNTAMLTFRDLATNDVGSYLYNTLMRRDNIDTGVGTIDLKIDRLADCAQRYKDLIKELSDEANLDMDEMEWI